MKIRGIGFVLALVAFSTVSAVMAPRVQAASFFVTTTADSGAGSLQQAIIDANAEAGPDLITFDVATNGVPIPAGSLPPITDSLTIQGNGVGQTIIGALTIVSSATRTFSVTDLTSAGVDATINPGATTTITLEDVQVENGLVAVDSVGTATVNLTRVDVVDDSQIELYALAGSLSAAMTDSRIENSTNSALIAFGAGASLTVERSLIANISGGGVTASGDARLTMRNSTITGIDDGQDAVLISGPTTLVNVTISGIQGSAILARGEVPIPVSLTNTIIRDTEDDSCSGSFVITSGGGNITDDPTCGLTQPGDLQSTDALLGALADNGGRTRTLLPQAGSPAIDGGAAADCPAVDQRDFERPVDGNGDALAICDSGAVEVEAVQPTTTTTTTTVVPTETVPAATVPAATVPAATVPAAAAPTTSMVTLLPETGAGTNTGITLIGAILLGLGSFLVLAVARRRPAS